MVFEYAIKGIWRRSHTGLAVVSGASRGIGLAISRAFLDEGLDVLGVAKDSGRLARMAKDIGTDGSIEGSFMDACGGFIYSQGGVARRGMGDGEGEGEKLSFACFGE